MKRCRGNDDWRDNIRVVVEKGDDAVHCIAGWTVADNLRSDTSNDIRLRAPTRDRYDLRTTKASLAGVQADHDSAEHDWVSRYAAIVRVMIGQSPVSCWLRTEQEEDHSFLTFMFEADQGDSFPVEIYVTGTTAFHTGSGWAEVTDIDEGLRIAARLLDRISEGWEGAPSFS